MRFLTIRSVVTTLLLALSLSSCTRKEAAPSANQPRAYVTMRDGTQVSGAVIATTATDLTLVGDDKVTRTIPVTQIRSVEYQEPAASASAANPAPDAAALQQQQQQPPQQLAQGQTQPPPATQPREHAMESAVTTRTYELPVGTAVPVRVDETIDSAKAVEGQTFAAEITRDIRDGAGDVVIPRGANAQVIIRSASKGGRIKGASDLVLDLKSVSIEGRLYQISTANIEKRGKQGIGANRRTGEFTGGGAAIGAIIGAIAGQGKGAAIGAASGAGAGAAAQLITRGGAIRIPAESVLTFRLDQPLRVVASAN